jgi:hypothetical protein
MRNVRSHLQYLDINLGDVITLKLKEDPAINQTVWYFCGAGECTAVMQKIGGSGRLVWCMLGIHSGELRSTTPLHMSISCSEWP